MLKITNVSLKLSVSAACLLVFIVPLSAAAGSEIYRCGPEGSQQFSQIPCEENSEPLVMEDHPMFSESTKTDSADDADLAETQVNETSDETNKAQAFITQLEKQRSEQLAEIDQKIELLQSESATDKEGNSTSVEGSSTLLTSLQTTRQSIVSEYNAMIEAARQRIQSP